MVADAEAARRTDEIPEWKREEVDELVELIERFDSVGVVDVTGIPSRQLQNMRRDLHGTAELRISRNTLLRRAIEAVDEGVEEVLPFVHGQVGLIGTDDNPFALYRALEASKTPAPINAGEIAPNDIVIPSGDTGIDPGPFVGELQQVGAEARIDEGSIRVTADSTVASAGEAVSQQLANVLSELDIEPKEVGLDLRGVYSDGVLFEPDELAIDVDAYRADVRAAASAGRNLSVSAAYPTAATVGALLLKASGAGKAVGVEAAIEDPDLLPSLVSRADAQVRQLISRIGDESALPEELRDIAAAPEGDADTAGDEDEDAPTEDEPVETPETDDGTDEDEDDEDGGAEGLGEMFG